MRFLRLISYVFVLICPLSFVSKIQGQTHASVVPPDPSTYLIQEVPKQLFTNGTEMSLKLKEVLGSVYTVSAEPKVNGSLAVDPDGMLTFVPASTDAGNISLTLTAKHPDGTVVSKQVIVSVFGNLPPEYTLVASAAKPPAEDSRRYITITETEDPSHRSFNNQDERKLVNVVISGKTVVIDKNDDASGIMARFDGRADVASLSIFAETIIFRSTLHLPETGVRLYAKQLRFEDGQQPVGTASLVTTPVSLTTNPGIGVSGANGLQAGGVSVNAGSFVSSGAKPRFVLTGGNGQDAGLGKKGSNGADMPCYKGVVLGDTCVVHVHQFAGPTSFGADNTWPGDGQPATAPGAPGVAGSGGNFTSNITALATYVTADPGQPGKLAQHVDGGDPGNPHHAINAEAHERSGGGQAPGGCLPAQYQLPCNVAGIKFFGIETEHYSHPGPGSDAPPIPVVSVSKGVIQTAGQADDWLNPILVRAVLTHAQDAYLDGALLYTQSVLESYLPAIDARLQAWQNGASNRDLGNAARLAQASIADRPAIQDELDRLDGNYRSLAQLRLEMSSIETRITNNLDYFGHPAGWVPQLSLAATLRSYQNEISKDIPILYLAYYVQESSADRARHLAALEQMQSQLAIDIKTSTDDLNSKQAALPALETEAGNLQNQLTTVQESLANKELELKARAQANVDDRNSTPFWKTGLKVLSAVATVCPVGQPAIGAVGIGLGVLANAGDQSIVDTAQQLGSLSDSFSQQNIAASVNQYHEQIAKLDTSNVKNLQTAETYAKGLVPLAQGLAKEYQAVNGALQTHKAPASEVDKELAQLEASDPEFTQISQQVTALNIAKNQFDSDLASVMTDTTRLSSQIVTDWISVDSTDRAISRSEADFDHEAVQEVAAFGRKTRDRLITYQYYLAKAYEYRLLRPYPGDFHLDKLLDELVRLTSATHDDTFRPLSPSDYDNLSAIYNESVQEVVSAGLDQMQNQPAPHESAYPFTLNQSQLDSLNRDGELDLDLGLAVQRYIKEDNRRLVSITVANATTGAPTDGSASQPIRISFEHGGTSTFRSQKHSYSFRHGRSAKDEPFLWSGLLTGTQWKDDVTPPEYLALLRQMLSLQGSPQQYQGLFAYPGLESTISITRQGGDAQPIASLNLLITYDFDPADEAEYPVDVVEDANIPALIAVSAADNSGRTLGQGNFTRYYNHNTHVTLMAPQQYGTHKFLEWDVPGQPPTTTPSLDIMTTKPTRATVRYTP